MEKEHLAHWLSKRSRPLTQQQWLQILNALEEKGLYMVIRPYSNSYTVSSYNAELVPLSSCEDKIELMNPEEVRRLGLEPCHAILKNHEEPKVSPIGK